MIRIVADRRNTVLLAVAAVGSSSKSPLLAVVSLGGFVIFGLLFGQLGGYYGMSSETGLAILTTLGHRRRSWLTYSFIFQLVILVSAAVLISKGPAAVKPEGKHEWIYMFLLSVQGGPQVTMVSRKRTVLDLTKRQPTLEPARFQRQ